MIYPSADLIELQVESKYALVILAAKRAKQIKEGSRSLIKTDSVNPLTIALEEIAAGVVTFKFDENSLAGREALADKEAVVGARDLEIEGHDPLALPDDMVARAASQLGAGLSDSLSDDELDEDAEVDEEEVEEEESPMTLADDEESSRRLNETMGRIVGIDLGTTNSVIAVLEGGEPTVIPLADGSRLCPSVVGFSKSGERLVGQLAKRQAITHPDRTIASIKRHIGDPEYRVAIDDKFLTPQEISAMILQKLKTDAEAYLGEIVDRAVITVPAYFSDRERQATKDAGRIAGLEVTRIINEPTAAALAYGMDKADVHTVLVWDLGGGTFDVSLLEVGDGVFEVKATNGDTHLGGDDWDERIVSWIADAFQRQFDVDLRSDKVALQRLREAAEKAKIELSSVVTTAINLPFIGTNSEGPVHLEMDLTRAQLEALTDDLRD